MCEQIEINVPAWFELNDLSPLEKIIPESSEVGFLVVGENFHVNTFNSPIVRLYLMNLIDGRFEVTKELDSYKFTTELEAQNFIKKLPKMSALELIVLQNNKQPMFL